MSMNYCSFFILILISFNTFGSSNQVADEAQAFVSTIKAKDVEEQLINSPKMGECAKLAKDLNGDEKKESIRKCFAQELDQKSDEEISKFAKEIELKDFDRNAAKSVSSIRDYLSDRFKNAIHGKDFDESKNFGTKDKKFIGQRKFFDLYESQIGKNVLMDISRYCLENLRLKNNKPIDVFCTNSKAPPFSGCIIEIPKSDDNPGGQTIIPLDGNTQSSINKYFGEIVNEVEFGVAGNTAKEIEEFAKSDFKKGGEYLKAKHSLCTIGISKLCLRYECNNSISDPTNKDCNSLISNWKPNPALTSTSSTSDIKLQDDSKTKTGRLACNLVTNLKAYRKNLIALKETTKIIDKNKDNNSLGYDVTIAYKKGLYNEGKSSDEKSIDEITTISSKELTENKDIEEISKLEEKADELIEKCKSKEIESLDDECKTYVENEDNFNEVEVEFEAITALELKRIAALKDDDEALQKYLKENGLKLENTSPEELVKIIAEKYKAERLAVINKLRDEFDKRKIVKDKQNPDAEEAQIKGQIQKAADEIKSKKDRIGTLVHYNNIVTSFLELVDEDGNKSQNTVSFTVEQEGFNEFEKDQEKIEEAEQYFTDLGENIDKDSKPSEKSALDIEVLEGIIGISVDKN